MTEDPRVFDQEIASAAAGIPTDEDANYQDSAENRD